MPVFTQICTAAPVATSTITATETCSCPGSEGILGGHPIVHFQGHLSTCALHTATLNGSAIPPTALEKLKQQVLLKHQQRLLLRQRNKDPFESVRLLPTRTGHLYQGSRFRGKQCSDSSSYDVMVDIKQVNLNDSSLCGYLHIKGLTEEYPELTTYFDAEIIGPHHSFLTHKWDATETTDEEHWTLFKPFEEMEDVFGEGDTRFDFRSKDVVFMRWKEHFLVPDHRVEGITGASFAGFYYICYHKRTGEINGYYYHRSSERFQRLILSHVDECRSFGSYEFR